MDNINVTTDDDGYATFTYTAVKETSGTETTWLNVSMPDRSENYTYRNFSQQQVPAFSPGAGDGGGDTVNPGPAGEVILSSADIGGGNGKDLVVLTLNNTNTDAVNLTDGRVEFYYSSGSKEYLEAALANGSYANSNNFPNNPAGIIEIGGGYESFQPDMQLNPGETEVTLEFRQSGGGNKDVDDRDFFIVTFVYEVDGEVERYRYFVNPN